MSVEKKIVKNKVLLPKPYKDLFESKSYRNYVYHGGRGSGKSWTVAYFILLQCRMKKIRVLATRETQNSIADSVHKLLSDLIIKNDWSDFEVQREAIRNTVTGSEIIFKGLKKDSQAIKSLEGIDICWVEEAQSVSQGSIDILIPTIRNEDSIVIWTANRLTQADPFWVRIAQKPSKDTFVKQVNSHDVEKIVPKVLKDERQKMKEIDEDMYRHIWLGEPLTTATGVVFGKQIDQAYKDKRIRSVPYDSSVLVYTAWDLGVSDSTSIWFYQLVGSEIHFIDHYENAGEQLSHYLSVINEKPYNYAKHFLPHDARARELQSGKSRESFFKENGFYNIDILPPNKDGIGIELTRGKFSRIWLDDKKCERGLECLKAFHYDYDEKNRLYKNKPAHDWSSHSASAFMYAIMSLDRMTVKNGPEFLVDSMEDKYGFY